MTSGGSAPQLAIAPEQEWDAVVIGGGFYGACLALELKKRMPRVAIVEREPGLLRRASFANQARVHNGYHYPRSILTAIRSRLSYARFRDEFPEAIDSSFTKVYAIPRLLSKLNAQQFTRYCKRIGADIAPAPKDVLRLFNPQIIEGAFVVDECAFDARVVERSLRLLLDAAGVTLLLGTDAELVEAMADTTLRVHIAGTAGRQVLSTQHAFNCTYSGINRLLRDSGLPLIPVKHELAEIALVDLPFDLRTLGITVMDGPFFSTMPFPSMKCHSLSHVRFTPHRTWFGGGVDSADAGSERALDDLPPSNVSYMLRDAARYVPMLAHAVYRESLWEIKTILPRSEHDDSRPVLLHRSPSARNVWSILGAKIDGVFDVQSILNEALDADRSMTTG